MVAQLVTSNVQQQLVGHYSTLKALEGDVKDADNRLGLHFSLKHSAVMANAAATLQDSKVLLGVIHCVNVLYVKAPKAKSTKERAGLVRELNKKLATAQ
eukprot:8894394-Alexandrium_andersonii.AAC.1